MTLVTDSFDRANGPLGNTDTGQPWEVLTGTADISLDRGRAQGGTIAVVDLGTGGQNLATLSVLIQSGAVGSCLYFRVSDANNWWRLLYESYTASPVSHVIRLQKCVAGVISNVGTTGNTPSMLISVQGGTISGSVYATGQTFNQGATKHGFGTASGSVNRVFDDFVADAPNLPPTAPALTYPVGEVTVNLDATVRASWVPADPNAGDVQSAYDLRYREVGDPTWIVVSGSTPNAYRDFASGTFTTADYEWQVRTYDALGEVGPYSASSFFSAASPPDGPVITAPSDGSTIGSQSTPLTWSTPVQDAYQVRTVADIAGVPDPGTVYYDSGTIEQAGARSAAVPLPVDGRDEHIQLRTRTSDLWSPWSSVRVSVSFTLPESPVVTVSPDDGSASILVLVDNPLPSGGQPSVTSHEVWRRETAVGGVGIRLVVGGEPGANYLDQTPAHLVDYEYEVVSIGSNGTSITSGWVGAPTPAPEPDPDVIDGGTPADPGDGLNLDGGAP